MLKINPLIIKKIKEASALDTLYPLLQSAIELEHATIPPYLTALFSFKPGTETVTRKIIHSIVIEEMLHMSIASNILNALGGSPDINKEGFVPVYPTHLPMGIAGGLIVGLEKYSLALVKNVFMEIEEPEDPLDIKTRQMAKAAAPTYHTIGEFYAALQQQIIALAPDKLPGDPSKQVTSYFYPAGQLFPILKKTDAVNAINIIMEQGEGTTHSPADDQGEIAHYYKFEELYKGLTLVKDPTAQYGYVFSNPAIPFDPNNVNPLCPNTKAIMFKPGTEERRRVDDFNTAYGTLLNGLHRTFNGEPGFLTETIGVMFDLKLYAEKLAATPFPGKPGFTIGPSFEAIPQKAGL